MNYARCTRFARYEIINDLAPFGMKQEFKQISRESVVSLRTTKSNCRVSSIDFYLIFPTSFRIITLPLTPDCPYTVIIHIRILTLALSLSLGQLCLIGACFVFSYSKGPLHIQKKINNNNKSIIRNSIITFFSQFLTCGYDFYCLK